MDEVLHAQLETLRLRLTQLERRHAAEIGTLKSELDALLAGGALMEPETDHAPPPLPKPAAVAMHSKAEPLVAPLGEEVVGAQLDVPLPEQALTPVVPMTQAVPAQAVPAQVEIGAKRDADGQSMEFKFGTVWLVRIGIALLLTGLVLLGNYAYRNWIRDLPNGVRLAGLYLCAASIGGTGVWLAKRPGLKRYGDVLVAGGMAFFYYCTYAAHHVGRLRVIENPMVAGGCLLGAAACITVVSRLRCSPVTAMLGFILASYATMLQPLGWLSAFSNVLLAAGGVALMRQPGWVGPGVVSMVGSYAAFAGWQMLGASRGDSHDPALLWFLPPTWLVFALPGLLGRFRESFTPRGCAWFTAANNGCFFVLFSQVWLVQRGSGSYWMVPAVFGLLLVVLGLLARRRPGPAGSVSVGQGLAALCLATVVKLHGDGLGLWLAAETLALAWAFRRYQHRTELVFAMLLGIMAFGAGFLEETLPTWSLGLTAVLMAGAGVLIRMGADLVEDDRRHAARVFAGSLVLGAGFFALLRWFPQQPQSWLAPLAMGFAAALSSGSLLMDRRRWLPEIAWIAGMFGIAAWLQLGQEHVPRWALALAAPLAFFSAWLWQRRVAEQGVVKGGVWLDPVHRAWPFAWCFALFVPMALWQMADRSVMTSQGEMGALALAGLLLAGLSIRCRCGIQLIASMVLPALSLAALRVWHPLDGGSWLPAFVPTLCLLLTMAWLVRDRAAGELSQRSVRIAGASLRGMAFLSWFAAWHNAAPHAWVAVFGLTAVGLAALARSCKWPWPVETWAAVGVGMLGLFDHLAEPQGWAVVHRALYAWDGVAVGAWLALSLMKVAAESGWRCVLHRCLPYVAVVAVALWSSQLLVQVEGWKPMAVWWTVLGFVCVSGGLWLRKVEFRQVGFALFAAALLKVFARDIWDYAAFMRVVSFLALGVALLLLGLFYHRFAPTLKRWLEEEGAPPE